MQTTLENSAQLPGELLNKSFVFGEAGTLPTGVPMLMEEQFLVERWKKLAIAGIAGNGKSNI